MKIAALRVFVDDLAAARDFYAGALGLPLREDGSRYGWCVFDGGGVSLILESVAREAAPDDRALVGRFVGVSFEVRDVEAHYARLCGMGVRFTGAPAQQPWGGVLATLADPSGNLIQLVQRDS